MISIDSNTWKSVDIMLAQIKTVEPAGTSAHVERPKYVYTQGVVCHCCWEGLKRQQQAKALGHY